MEEWTLRTGSLMELKSTDESILAGGDKRPGVLYYIPTTTLSAPYIHEPYFENIS